MPGDVVSRIGVPPPAGTLYTSQLPFTIIDTSTQRPSGEKRGAKVVLAPSTISRLRPDPTS